MTERIVIATPGASGAVLGIRALQMLRDLGLETHLIVSPAASVTIAQETEWKVSDVLALASVHYEESDIAAPVASGSFATRGMIVIPCSVKTLPAVATSHADDR